jgi:hypothetical protein
LWYTGKALTEGVKAFEPGLLVQPWILYVDEVNLLDDHLVDVLLDSAALVGTQLNVRVFHQSPGKFYPLVLEILKKVNYDPS